ncbi:MAG: hypothetical protein AABZ30_07570 [Myxococcota bacterium]
MRQAVAAGGGVAAGVGGVVATPRRPPRFSRFSANVATRAGSPRQVLRAARCRRGRRIDEVPEPRLAVLERAVLRVGEHDRVARGDRPIGPRARNSELRLSRERVRQLEVRARGKLRRALEIAA